eukprot:5020995-Pleurochrysis_carterae.AAC.1
MMFSNLTRRLSKNAKKGVRSGIGGSGGEGGGKSTRRTVQTPKCICAQSSALLSASPSLTDAEKSRKGARERDFCPAPRPHLKV